MHHGFKGVELLLLHNTFEDLPESIGTLNLENVTRFFLCSILISSSVAKAGVAHMKIMYLYSSQSSLVCMFNLHVD